MSSQDRLGRHPELEARSSNTRAVIAVMVLAATSVIAALGGAPSAAGQVTADGSAEPAAEELPTMRRAALRLVISTTSDWVRVDLPGASAGHVVVDNPHDRTVRPTGRGVVVRGPVRVFGTVSVDVVTEVPRSFELGAITVSQGGIGKSTVEVTNITGDPYSVAAIATSWSAMNRSVGVTAAKLMGDEQLEWVRAEPQRRVLAFTYPWFGDWAKTDSRLSAHPSDPWNSRDPEDALAMARMARANGIDGFVMSFSGGKAHGLPLHHSLEAAAATGGTATVLIETAAAGSAAVTEQWISQALEQADHPAFQRLDGVPVVFAFATGTLTPDEWVGISDRLAAAGTPVRIISDTWQGGDGPHAGHYRYSSLLQRPPADEMTNAELTYWNHAVSRGLRAAATLGAGEADVVVATVQPGFDVSRTRGDDWLVVDRKGTATYDATWQAALAAEPDWVVVTSWNEWYEGTGIAPTAELGTAPLDATARWAERFKG